jgi:hypothetical protein
VANSIGSTMEGLSFSGLSTRVEIGHIRIGSAGKGRIKSRGSGSSLSQRGIMAGRSGMRSRISTADALVSVVLSRALYPPKTVCLAATLL